MSEAEEFAASLPRSRTLEGNDLRIVEVREDGAIVVSDGKRGAVYAPVNGTPLGGELRIVPAYVEAGYFSEANCITVTDGTREAVYLPVWAR
ncbi:hypothetical protein [Mesorhizobium sp. RMAD-H1]|uniref:hypothetical protein n=1 Tax=Mesorhizobium sp. RMAD-H1 TaxID=2587065 RepID=UPI00160F8F40|nr:hypothetical protein [Mesorhizobium sp. RMAD-H1]MBB2974335.1 hypothetical protein [Mesorhizobium sp. RMAD-H1]